ncbi:glycoside hydrolase superfamily [Leptodontidium sp. 2 PMI_412]|nr:glycoside hydrolase superfamily [Leptodontidium sp. 2 PMI_412]
MRFLYNAIAATLLAQTTVSALSVGGREIIVKKDSSALQDIVTYDQHSLMVHGERMMVFSGEFHAFRLPVPDLWLDIFQKVKALGFSAVSFYTHWALLEGEPGVYNASGVNALEPFFEAASQAGLYLIARPGPYINAEVSGGGFPGWLQRVKGELRTQNPDYMAATHNYVASISKTIAKYQITNGGPVILLQPENEYSGAINSSYPFPDPVYFAALEKQYRDAGIVVPFISNDAWPHGYFAPGSTTQGTSEANVDIYGYDNYPIGFDCANPTVWAADALPTTFADLQKTISPSTFNSINEFQSGAFDIWGGSGFDQCAKLVNMESERVFFKNNFAAGTKLLNLYMIFGGTNWGNLGYAEGYTSYDYAAAITENRELNREKYSEIKLQGNFLKVSPAYLTASRGNRTTSEYTDNPAITVTPLLGNGSETNFYVVRHTDYQELTAVSYSMKLPSSRGNLVVPQLRGALTLSGRDSKWVVTDYDIGDSTILYSTAEIFTWQKFEDKTVVVVYGGPGELHELALLTSHPALVLEGTNVATKSRNGTTILNWQTSPTRRVIKMGSIVVYALDRNTAYNYWTPTFERSDVWGNYSANVGNTTAVIVEAGYLVRKVYTVGRVLHIDGDVNATVPFKIIGAPKSTTKLKFNNETIPFITDYVTGEWTSTLHYSAPTITLPDLATLEWKKLNSLPELSSSYDDSDWIVADHNTTNNLFPLRTSTSLYSSDYGYHTGALIYRGSFVAKGSESTFYITTIGGSGHGSSVWLDDTYIGSWIGAAGAESHDDTYKLPELVSGRSYVFTVVVDNNGLQENWNVGADLMKTPRGILNYTLSGQPQSAITWKLTGNFGGEKYVDKVRGPLNEGGLYAERQGFHQPGAPTTDWPAGSPFTGISSAGIAFYQTSFKLDLPSHYDIPLSFRFGNTTIADTTSNYLAILYVNGWQFGKYINNLGPQSSFPVPQGILDYHGDNFLAVGLWARDASGAKLTNFSLNAGTPVWTSFSAPALAPSSLYTPRTGAY